MLIRRKVMENIGGFDPVFFIYKEDIDLPIRIGNAGYKILSLSTAKFCHRIQGSQRNVESPFVERWSPFNPNYSFHAHLMVMNSIIKLRKHITAKNVIDYLMILPLFLILKSLKAARILGSASFKPVLRGVREGLSTSLSDRGRCQLQIRGDNAS